MSTYTVKTGDSLSSIARDQLGSMNRWREIATLNRLSSTIIRPGQTLQLPDDEIPEVVVSPPPRINTSGTPAAIESLAPSPEMMQEVTVTGKRIDYTVVALLLFGAWMLFGQGRGR